MQNKRFSPTQSTSRELDVLNDNLREIEFVLLVLVQRKRPT